MMYRELSPFVFDCDTCPTRCDGVSKSNYQFQSDADFSEQHEKKIIEIINTKSEYNAQKTSEPGYPDIEIRNKRTGEISYLEIKVQQRTFMSVKKFLPMSGLSPSETVALNLSDLIRYFKLQDNTQKNITILWVLLNRACIVKSNAPYYFYQNVEVLKNIYQKHLDNRRFRRASGEGDVVDGIHKGVTVNYHFSLSELARWQNPTEDA